MSLIWSTVKGVTGSQTQKKTEWTIRADLGTWEVKEYEWRDRWGDSESYKVKQKIINKEENNDNGYFGPVRSIKLLKVYT